MLRGRCSCAIPTRPATSSGVQTERPTSSFALHPLTRRSFSGGGPLSSTPSPATLPLSTLVQSSLPTPLLSTHAHLYHSRPPITPAVPTLANLVFPNSFPCNTCEKNTRGRRADISVSSFHRTAPANWWRRDKADYSLRSG